MASISEETPSVIREFHITIVDFVGALMPGIVWFVLLATALSLAKAGGNPLDTAKGVVNARWIDHGTKTEGEFYVAVGAFYIAVGLASVLLGWVIKATGILWADRLCAGVLWIWDCVRHWKNPRKHWADYQIYRFPYSELIKIENGDALRAAQAFANDHVPATCTKAPLDQPFLSCKLVLRHSDALFSQEAERAEAQVSLLGSLFLASVFSFVLAIYALWPTGAWDWRWIVGSTLAAVYFGYSFHTDRRAEVNRTYLMTLLLEKRQEDKQQLKQAAAAAGADAAKVK